MRVIVSDHAFRQLKRRSGAHHLDSIKMARRAWERAEAPPQEWPVRMFRQNTGQYRPDRAGHRYAYYRYAAFVFVFDRDAADARRPGWKVAVLITVLGPYDTACLAGGAGGDSMKAWKAQAHNRHPRSSMKESS